MGYGKKGGACGISEAMVQIYPRFQELDCFQPFFPIVLDCLQTSIAPILKAKTADQAPSK